MTRHDGTLRTENGTPLGSPLRERVASFVDLADDWDSYGATPLPAEVIQIAEAMATALEHPAQAGPGSDGSVSFEWGSLDARIVLTIEPDGDVSLYVRAGEREWETVAFRAALTPEGDTP